MVSWYGRPNRTIGRPHLLTLSQKMEMIKIECSVLGDCSGERSTAQGVRSTAQTFKMTSGDKEFEVLKATGTDDRPGRSVDRSVSTLSHFPRPKMNSALGLFEPDISVDRTWSTVDRTSLHKIPPTKDEESAGGSSDLSTAQEERSTAQSCSNDELSTAHQRRRGS